jgi:acetone carboxylase gamma subunit
MLSGLLDEERFRRYLEFLIPKLRVEDLIILKERIEKELAKLERGRAIAANSPPQD